MNQRSSAPARALASIALVCGVLVIAIVVATSLDGDGDDGRSVSPNSGGPAAQHEGAQAHTPKAYVVQSGDTLTSIAHETGVPVARIRALNPGIDPQILISGEKLKLR
jgi:LysM repeat protein